MPIKMPKCKITVLKRTIDKKLVEEFLDEEFHNVELCELFEEGQEFVIDDFVKVPDNFCPHAWADIRKDVHMVAYGGNVPGFRQKGTTIAGCTDWFRPVIFKIERID